MTYTATWQNGNAQGRLTGGVHAVRLPDADELAERINRRRLLIYKYAQDFSGQVYSGARVRQSTVRSAVAPPFDSFRINLTSGILSPASGALGGAPPTPAAMDWLWPIADGDENKILVAGDSPIGDGQVGLLNKLNGTNHWTDPTLTAGWSDIRAVHFNELRQAVEWISRGRWRLPIYLTAGIFSALPDTPWISQAVAYNGTVDLRSLGYAIISPADTPARGLVDVAVRSSSSLTITADRDCTIEVRRCLRPIAWQSDPPTWNRYAPAAGDAWDSPGAGGAGDSVLIGSVVLPADQPGAISNPAMVSALQAMIDGGEPHFLLRRTDVGTYTVNVTAEVTIEFDLDPDQ